MGNLTNLAGLSRELNLPQSWLRAEADAKRIPCLRVGRKRFFNIKAVENVLAERAAGSNRGQIESTDRVDRRHGQ